MFLAHYINRITGETYYRTVRGDNLIHAMKVADRFANKGFLCVSVKSVNPMLFMGKNRIGMVASLREKNKEALHLIRSLLSEDDSDKNKDEEIYEELKKSLEAARGKNHHS